MKKRQPQKLQLSKIAISRITMLAKENIKGGTDTVSVPMSEAPDKHGVCYQIR